MFLPDDMPIFPSDGPFPDEVGALIKEKLDGPFRSLATFISAEQLQKASVRIAGFVKAYVHHYPCDIPLSLYLFADMLQLSFEAPDEDGAFFLGVHVLDEQCRSRVKVDPLCRLVPEDDEMVMARLVLEKSFEALSKQLQASEQCIREGKDRDRDLLFLNILGGRKPLIHSIHQYSIEGHIQFKLTKFIDLVHSFVCFTLEKNDEGQPLIRVMELTRTLLANLIFDMDSSILIRSEKSALFAHMKLPRGDEDGSCSVETTILPEAKTDFRWEYPSITPNLLPDTLLRFFRQLFTHMSQRGLWEWEPEQR